MESSIEFNQELAASLYQSTDSFPVDFLEAWQWLKYSRKDVAKRALFNSGFIENQDFRFDVERITTGFSGIRGGDVNENIYLTVECFKLWSMMSGTEQGKKVRLYFLECEKISKQVTEIISPALLEVLTSMQKEMKVLSIRTQRLDAIDKATDTHKGLAGVVETEVMEIYPDILSYTVKEYLQMKGVSEEHLHTMRKRAVMFANQGKQTKLPTKGKEYVFVGNDISYLDQALKTVLGLD